MKQITLAIVQARMSSSRLPGKVLMDIAGKPMLQHVIDRSMQAKSVDQVVLATTNDPSDDILENFCQQQAWQMC
jgi:spore coat polysaccharide biosynthesis protein SpsF (cytidylyltransferase family)